MDVLRKFWKKEKIKIREVPRYSVNAVLVYKGRPVSFGYNSYKSHPRMLEYNYRAGAIYLHAELDCLIKAPESTNFSKCSIYIKRLGKQGQPELAKPCSGCEEALLEFGLKPKNIWFTTREGWENLDEYRAGTGV